MGFEIDLDLVRESRQAIERAGLQDLAVIYERDLRTVDLSPASVVTIYLHPAANLRLRSAILRELKPGARVVSHEFDMGDWRPAEVTPIHDATGVERTLYLWRI